MINALWIAIALASISMLMVAVSKSVRVSKGLTYGDETREIEPVQRLGKLGRVGLFVATFIILCVLYEILRLWQSM